MPELPEVENYRRLLLPLVSTSSVLSLECPSPNPPKSFLSAEDFASLHENCFVSDVQRKGKLLCVLLDLKTKVRGQKHLYLFLHMGMTGRISTPSHIPSLESLTNPVEYPLPHTYLVLKTGTAEAAFSDPRKFGSVLLSTSMDAFDDLAPDAWNVEDLSGLVGRPSAIKALLLDQKRAVSGVGNWVADEILYQSELHPEQNYLTEDQVERLRTTLQYVLTTAIDSLQARQEFPSDWLFHRRWHKRLVNRGGKLKDAKGRTVEFLKAAGRTSAIVPSVQKKRSRCSADAKKESGTTGAEDTQKVKPIDRENKKDTSKTGAVTCSSKRKSRPSPTASHVADSESGQPRRKSPRFSTR